MAAARIAPSIESLEILEDLYAWEDDGLVRRLLEAHPETHEPLIHAAGLVPRYFGSGARLSLEVDYDREGSGPPTLAATIYTSQSPTEALSSLDRFDDDWWLDAMVNVHRHLSFHLRFV